MGGWTEVGGRAKETDCEVVWGVGLGVRKEVGGRAKETDCEGGVGVGLGG